MKYVIALLATLFALPALAHGPQVSVSTEPTSGIVNTGDRYSVMLDFDLVAGLGAATLGDLGDVTYDGLTNGKTLKYLTSTNTWTPVTPLWNMNSITDVEIAGGSTGATEDQLVVWDDTTNRWRNKSHHGTELPVTWASGDTSPSVMNGSSYISSPTALTWITRLDDAIEGWTYFVTFTNSNTLIDFTGSALKGNENALWGPVAGNFMACRIQAGVGYCEVDGSNGISGDLPVALGPNDEFVFDASGTLTLNTPGAGIVVAPSATLGSQMVLPSSTNSGGNAFTLKVLDAGLTSAVNCLIEADGALNSSCPLLDNLTASSELARSDAIRSEVAAHLGTISGKAGKHPIVGQLGRWRPWGSGDTIVLVSANMFNGREYSYAEAGGESYLVTDVIRNDDPVNLTKQTLHADTTECNGASQPIGGEGNYNCARELTFNTAGDYEIRVTMLRNRNKQYGFLATDGGGPQEVLAGGAQPSPINSCTLYWYIDNNFNLFATSQGGNGFDPGVNSTLSVSTNLCTSNPQRSPGTATATICDTRGINFDQATSVRTYAAGSYIGVYREPFRAVGVAQYETVEANWRDSHLTQRGSCSWTGFQDMGIFIVEARKI